MGLSRSLSLLDKVVEEKLETFQILTVDVFEGIGLPTDIIFKPLEACEKNPLSLKAIRMMLAGLLSDASVP